MAKRKEWLQKSIIFAGSEKCKHEITFVKFWASIVLVTEVRNNMLYVLFLLNVDMLPYKIKSCYIRNSLRDEQNDSFATDSDKVTRRMPLYPRCYSFQTVFLKFKINEKIRLHTWTEQEILNAVCISMKSDRAFIGFQLIRNLYCWRPSLLILLHPHQFHNN
jgi:hypothetical protein